MNIDEAFKTFETVDLRKRFVATTEADDYPNGWRGTKVTITDTVLNKVVYTFHRNYSFAKTFAPFRLWDDENLRWRYFALISPEYTDVAVVDLTSGELIAEVSNEFCPVEFYVTDYFDFLKEDFTEETLTKAFTEPDLVEYYKEALAVWLKKRSFAFVSGCFWGDDWSWKLRTIKLDEVLAGNLGVPEDKFGYFVVSGPLPEQIKKDYFFDEGRSLELKTVTYWRLDDEGVPKSGQDYNEPPSHLVKKDGSENKAG